MPPCGRFGLERAYAGKDCDARKLASDPSVTASSLTAVCPHVTPERPEREVPTNDRTVMKTPVRKRPLFMDSPELTTPEKPLERQAGLSGWAVNLFLSLNRCRFMLNDIK